MAKDVEQLLEKVCKYLKRLQEECKLPPKLETDRAELLEKIERFIGNDGTKLNGGFSILKNFPKLKSPLGKKSEGDGDDQSLSSQLTQSTTVSSNSEENDSNEIQPVPAASMSTAMKSGFLFKIRKDEKYQSVFGPQKRWCAIKDGNFYYFKSDKSLEQKGAFLLRGYEAYCIGKEETSCAFNITCPGQRTYLFTADSNYQMNQWVRSINFMSESQTKVCRIENDTATVESSDLPPIAPRRGLSANRALDDPDHDSLDSIGSYEDTDFKSQGNARESVTSIGLVVYEDTNNMELDPQKSIAPPGLPKRTHSKSEAHCSILSTDNDYEDTELLVQAIRGEGYSNNLEQNRLTNSSSGLYEDTDPPVLPVLPPKKTSSQRPDKPPPNSLRRNLPPGDTASFVTAKSNEIRKTIHPPGSTRDSDLYEDIGRLKLYYALYNSKAVEADELQFSAGDIIRVLYEGNEGWWTGQLKDKIGLVPRNFLTSVYKPKDS